MVTTVSLSAALPEGLKRAEIRTATLGTQIPQLTRAESAPPGARLQRSLTREGLGAKIAVSFFVYFILRYPAAEN